MVIQVYEAQNFHSSVSDTTTIVVYINGEQIWTVQDTNADRPRSVIWILVFQITTVSTVSPA